MQLKKIKILHIITQLDLGGAQKNALDIVRLLDRKKYEIYFVSSDKGLLIKDALAVPGVKVIFLSSLRRPINPLFDLITLCRLILLFKKEGIDLVHTHSSKSGILGRWAARLAGVPVVVHTIHGWSFHNHLNLPSKYFYCFLEKITARFTDKLIAVSRSDIQKGLRNHIATKDKYLLIHYGISRDEFVNCHIDIHKKKKELGLDPGSAIVGMVACLKPQKSPQDFLYVASLMHKNNPKIKFILVGDGILRKQVEHWIDTLNLQDSFVLTGWRRDIPEIMRCLDVLVLTSLWEGAPIVFLEAMSCRVPIVAYNVDGNQELIKDGINGFLVAPRDFAGLAERTNKLLEDRNLLEEMGRSGFNLAMNNGYSLGRMLKDLDHLYCRLAAKAKICQRN